MGAFLAQPAAMGIYPNKRQGKKRLQLEKFTMRQDKS